MSWAHLIFGLILFVVFTVTGYYMRVDFPDKDAIPPELRLLMRSRHIYILFSALMHILLGVYLRMAPRAWQRVVQYLGSALLTAASLILLWAWYVETYELAHFSDLSRWGIYLSLTAVVTHLIGGFGERPKASR